MHADTETEVAPVHTRDDQRIETLIDHLEDLEDLEREIPKGGINEYVFHEHDHQSTIPYDALPRDFREADDHLQNWLNNIKDDIGGTVAQNNYHSTDRDAEGCYTGFRYYSGDNRKQSLVLIDAEHYSDGDVHIRLSVRTGYHTSDATSGGIVLEEREVANDFLLDIATDLMDDRIQDTLRSLRPYIMGRVTELVNDADAAPRHAQAIALDEYGYSNAEIADLLDVSESAVRSYKTKFNYALPKAQRLFIFRRGAPKTILSSTVFHHTNYEYDALYVTELVNSDAYSSGTDRYSFIRIRGDDQTGGWVDVSTNTYESLAALVHEEYETRSIEDLNRAKEFYNTFAVLEDVDSDTLTHPKEKVRET